MMALATAQTSKGTAPHMRLAETCSIPLYFPNSWRWSQNDIIIREVGTFCRLILVKRPYNVWLWEAFPLCACAVPYSCELSSVYGVYVNPRLLETESESVACIQLWGSTLGGIAFGIMWWCHRAIYSLFLCLVPYPWISLWSVCLKYFVPVSRFLYSCIYAIADTECRQHADGWAGCCWWSHIWFRP